jgi:peptidoglycan/xylan/chitin deacetylase (PgdA/CDA1 family)
MYCDRRTRPELIAAIFRAGAFMVLIGMPAAAELESTRDGVAILLYHRFGPVCTDEETVRVSTFQDHLQYLQDHHYQVIRLDRLIAYKMHKAPAPPTRSVVITIDDDSESIYTQAFPLVKRFQVPVTLFIYPSAISNASYALTWSQLQELKESGFFDIQSHTYWHPNFKREKKRLTPAQYDELVQSQLGRSKSVLESRLGNIVTMLAWPFGIYDNDLIRKALGAGYVAGFTLERRHATDSDNIMALPRYLITDTDEGRRFEALLGDEPPPTKTKREARAASGLDVNPVRGAGLRDSMPRQGR